MLLSEKLFGKEPHMDSILTVLTASGTGSDEQSEETAS